MAGKRPSTQEHMIYSKLAREEGESMHCHDDLISYKTILSSLPCSDGPNSLRPWSSATAYLQYAGSALSQHLRTDGAPEGCQRPVFEGSKNQPHVYESMENQFHVQQRSLLGYPMSSSVGCPPLAMPQPLYRSPVGYVDAGYGPVRHPSLGAHVGSPLRVPSIEWSSPLPPYVSPPAYGSGLQKKNLQPQLVTEETGRRSESLSRGLQELNPVYQHRREDTSAAILSHTQGESYIDFSPSLIHPKIPTLLYAQGDTTAIRQRGSAFSSPSQLHHTYKSSTFQVGSESRLKRLHSGNHYSPTRNSFTHRPGHFTSSLGTALMPGCVKGTVSHLDTEIRPATAHINREVPAEQLQVKSSQADLRIGSVQADQELRVCSAHSDWEQRVRLAQTAGMEFWMGKVRRQQHVTTTQEESELRVGSVQVNREFGDGASQENRKLTMDSSQEDYFQSKNLHRPQVSFFTPGQNSYSVSAVSTDLQPCFSTQPIASLPAKESTPVSHVSGLQSTLNPPAVCNVRKKGTDPNPTNKYIQTTSVSKEKTNPVICFSSSSSYLVAEEQPKSRHSDGLNNEFLSPVQETVSGGSRSPPMPIIHDVFSLAPYRGYLEGKAPYPFTSENGPAVGSKVSIIAQELSEIPLDIEEQSAHSPRLSDAPEICESRTPVLRCKGSVHDLDTQKASVSHTKSEDVVLDLSLKKLPTTDCFSQDKDITQIQTSMSLPVQPSISVPCRTIASLPCQTTAGLPIQSTLRMPFQTTACLSSPSTINLLYQTNTKLPSQTTMSWTSQPMTSWSPQTNPVWLPRTPPPTPTSCPPQTPTSCPPQTPTSCLPQTPTSCLPQTPTSCLPQTPTSCPPQAPTSCPPQASTSCPPQAPTSCSPQILQSRHSPISTIYSSRSSIPCSSKSLTVCLPQPLYLCSFQAPVCTSQSSNLCPPNSHSIFASQSSVLPMKNPDLCSSHFPTWQSEHTRERTRCKSNSSHLLTPPTGSDNECNGFHSFKSFMFKKYKMMKLASTDEDKFRETSSSVDQVLSSSFLLPSESVHSLPPSAPEASPMLGEANVSLASGGESAQYGSMQHFTELHRSVRMVISTTVTGSPSDLLKDWLLKTKDEEKTKSPLKSKSGSRSTEHLLNLPGRDVWMTFDGVRLILHKLLSQLETFMFTRCCPFPHVIRAGAIFIPIHLVKEILFPELLGASVDRILQGHKVELRPTTLSEEKLLRDTELKDCSSRMLKLLALKQLPDVYPDLLHLYWSHCVQRQLGDGSWVCSQKEKKGPIKEVLLPVSINEKPTKSVSPQKESPLVLKLQRVHKHLYRAKKLRPTKDKNINTLTKGLQITRKKYNSKKREKFSYRKRRRPRRKINSQQRFPELVGKRILHLFDDGKQESWFAGRVLRIHRRYRNPKNTQYEVWYDDEPDTRYFLELLQDYEKGWLRLES